jgi:DMSO reductase family type II enzyme chaperone
MSDTPLDADVRSSALRILALPFRYPVEEVLDAFGNGDYEEALRDHGALLPHLAAAVERARPALEAARARLASTTFTEFEVAFTGTFLAGMPEPPCPPYEGLVRANENRVTLLLEVSDFYRHFDLKMDPSEGRNEHPDHLRAELEFLQFLCLKEAQARRERTPELLHGYVLAQRDFLERHLARWARPFAERLAAAARHPWFSACARLLADHVEGELALVERYLPALAAALPAAGGGAAPRPRAAGQPSAA